MIVCIAKFKVKPGRREDFLKNSRPCIQASRDEKGNIGYDALLDPDDPDGIVYVEQWESMDAANAHGKSEHFLANQPQSAALREGKPKIVMYEAQLATQFPVQPLK
ncbi:antibiotic biosynthesis monooxygenase [Treponema primitia ZAS-2]|uniref:Antibiotic biosynthesis monooxygenase n=1 Tax=Treponema primitia (strain ATCC BAA-887 / DSM 12427 / ZAS-2) TaxID=545694 RepID=F5YK76_TREPZ|nr:putative quinol monooxygenase [Treponema primitia]AEF85096.1 antibiotic biosynthesis monooxygenase [Treponema primitia ZAS-2]